MPCFAQEPWGALFYCCTIPVDQAVQFLLNDFKLSFGASAFWSENNPIVFPNISAARNRAVSVCAVRIISASSAMTRDLLVAAIRSTSCIRRSTSSATRLDTPA